MAKILTRWIRKHIYEISASIAVVAVLISCVGTFRALDELPQMQQELVSLEEGLEKLSGIRLALSSAMLRTRALMLREAHDAADNALISRITDSVARGQQLVSEVLHGSPSQPLQVLASRCQDQFAQILDTVTSTKTPSNAEQFEFQQQGITLSSQLQLQIAAGRQQLEKRRQSAQRQRQQTTYRLIGGHGLMLAVIGLLYFARRTERRQRELADLKLLESDERFALIVRGSADGIIVTDAAGKIQMTNPAVDAMFDCGDHEWVGQPVASLFETTIIDEWLTHRLDEDHEASLCRTVMAKRRDGKHFDAELTITPRTIHNQQFLAISVRDVSEREISRLRLKQHEALLREIPEPLQILDAAGRIIYWNVGAQRLFGYSASEAIGKTANDLLRIIPPDGNNANIHAAEYTHVDRWTGELEAISKTGTHLRIERRRTRITEDDDTIGEVIFDLNLDERSHHQLVQRRQQRLEALGTLASGIAHDLNNLLTPILMGSRMLQRGGENLDRDALLATIVSGASRGAELISQLLTFARGGDGQHRPVDICEVMSEVSGILAHTLKNKVTLEVDVKAGLPEIMGDATEISQVIMNLAVNARDAMPSGGTLNITASRLSLAAERTYSLVTLQPGNYLAVAVKDTGTGIPAGIRDHIFDPFFSTKERGQGTGLGLSTSLGIVRSHNGAIDVNSNVGEGTTVTVILPIIEDSHN